MNWIPEKLRLIRQEFKMTQLELAQASGLSQRDISQLENGRKEGLPKEYIQFLHSRGVNLNWLFADPAAVQETGEPFSAVTKKYALLADTDAPALVHEAGAGSYARLPSAAARVSSLSMVDATAALDYPQRCQEPAFYQALPQWQLPVPEVKSGTFRCFQVADASMQPVFQPQDWLIAQLMSTAPTDIEYSAAHVVVTKTALLITRLVRAGEKAGTVVVKADALGAAETEVPLREVVELWRVTGRLSFHLPSAYPVAEQKVDSLEANLKDLLDRVQRLEQGR